MTKANFLKSVANMTEEQKRELPRWLSDDLPGNGKRGPARRATTQCQFGAKKWDYVVTVAETLVKMLPKETKVWIQRSFALHRLGRTQEAFDKMLPAAEKFSKVWTIPFSLACHCAQLGRLDECQDWFK